MSLAEHLDSEHERAESFVVDDLGRADWALRKLAAIREQIGANSLQAQEWCTRAGEWLADVNEPLKRDETYFTGLLERFALGEREQGRKSVKLPSGQITTRTVGESVEVTDEAAALAYCRDNQPGLIQVQERVRKSGWLLADGAARDPSTGFPVPGLTVKPGRVAVQVST